MTPRNDTTNALSRETLPKKRPNFLIILADDLGFSDIGPFGSEIRTPNLDELAKSSLRFTDFHAAAACSPSRAMLMTGTDHHIAGLGNLIEWTNQSGQNDPSGKMSTAPQRGMPGYEGYLNSRVVALPELLHDSGYFTCMAGKWHLGLKPEHGPQARGFEKSFAHLPACSNHYGFEPQLERERGDCIPEFMTMSYIALHTEDGEYVKQLPENWYSSNGYGDKMLQYLQEWKSSNDEKKSEEEGEQGRPFFAYLPFTAPHWPLQAPREYINHYAGVYDSGPDILRSQRLQRLKDLGLIPADVEPHPVIAPEVAEWPFLSAHERANSSKAMEVYAAMIECIDANVGKCISYLNSIGELNNTFIAFLSDNGAEGAAYEAYPIVRGSMLTHLQKYYNNSIGNLGNADSFIWYGPRWAQAATAPSRLYKAYTTEGGVRVPFLAKWPGNALREREGSVHHGFATIMDIAPTVLEMAGVVHPAPSYRGRHIVPMRGKSMIPFISSSSPSIHEVDFVEGWETCGRAALRRGDWKIVFVPKPKGPERWQLYNLRVDLGEVHDLAEQEPEYMKVLLRSWEQYVVETGVVPLAPELGEWVEAAEGQMEENMWIEYEYWKEGARDKPEKFFKTPPRFERGVGGVVGR
ncbi:alkaline phosphatase-like protein [Lepidopterella palustris CBS 459.81]|uniref:Alkaline phosphatase-like protein n=1 Tax=Lepidopterella palustris CBS 459.81 TaxID=1314670 RepID=A0A8E2E7P9_9PEZI|nr:alkaline phosphatase-like protein [Lepidopterella palustris CBS 459.81]